MDKIDEVSGIAHGQQHLPKKSRDDKQVPCGVKSLHPSLLARTLQGMKNAQLESQGSENTYILAR
jgi:hypothetical protein